MDFSPLYISLKTAGLATVITFILGIYAARFICKLKKYHAGEPHYDFPRADHRLSDARRPAPFSLMNMNLLRKLKSSVSTFVLQM